MGVYGSKAASARRRAQTTEVAASDRERTRADGTAAIGRGEGEEAGGGIERAAGYVARGASDKSATSPLHGRHRQGQTQDQLRFCFAIDQDA